MSLPRGRGRGRGVGAAVGIALMILCAEGSGGTAQRRRVGCAGSGSPMISRHYGVIEKSHLRTRLFTVQFPMHFGELSERLKEHDWKSCRRQKRLRGSNPRLSARFLPRRGSLGDAPRFTPSGGVAEWLNAAVSKTVYPTFSGTRVRIPPPPPFTFEQCGACVPGSLRAGAGFEPAGRGAEETA